MTLAETLWQENQDLAIACLQHPFVQGIGNGSLDKAKFSHYVGQDAFFLEAFARAYSIAAAKAPDWRGFQVFHELAGGVLHELTLHEGYATQWGGRSAIGAAGSRHTALYRLFAGYGLEPNRRRYGCGNVALHEALCVFGAGARCVRHSQPCLRRLDSHLQQRRV